MAADPVAELQERIKAGLQLEFEAQHGYTYLSPHSDIVALLVLAHQIEIHNLIATADAAPDADPKDAGEPLVQALLFEGAAPLNGPVDGSSDFAAEFSKRGPRDSKGR